MTPSDFIWQAAVICAFGALGAAMCRAIVAGQSDRRFPALLRKARHLYLAFPLLLALPSTNVYVASHPSLQWSMPDWLQLHWAALSWGIVSAILAYVFGFCSVAAAAGGSRWKRMPVYFGVAVLLIIQIYAGWSSRPNLPALGGPRISPDGVILQTTPFTCVPASGANIATLLGVPATEKELVKLFHTTRDGTFPAAALRGMRELGIDGQKVTTGNDGIRNVHPPAMLFVLGDTHAFVYIGRSGNELEIWNPSTGQGYITEERLSHIWSGHALEFHRAKN